MDEVILLIVGAVIMLFGVIAGAVIRDLGEKEDG